MEDLDVKPDNMVAVPEFGPRPTCDLHDKEDEEEDGPPDYTTTGVEKNLLKNGGIKKMVIKHGSDPSPQTPLYGDEVTVHYTGTLPDDTVFDSSRDKEPFTFKLGVGQVIKGWDKGIKTMRKGEQAIFTLRPQYAYGKEGSPPGIPPDTTLKFDIEVLSWCSVRDVTRNGGVLKKIVQEGQSWETPNDADEVTVKYEARLEDGTVVSKSPDEGVQYFVKDGIPHPLISVLHNFSATSGQFLASLSCQGHKCFYYDRRKGHRQYVTLAVPAFKPKHISVIDVANSASGNHEGLFCPAISNAVKSMKRAERVVLTVRPEYGFGSEGREAKDSEGAVPTNAVLIIDLEVLSWNSVETVTDDNLVVKKITRPGESYEKPNYGATVTVKYTGKLSDGTIFEKKGFDSEEPYKVIIDEGQVCPGLDEVFISMKKNEACIVTIPSEYGFEDEDKQCDLALVPANSTLTYEIEMDSFEKVKDPWDMDTAHKLVEAAKKKDEGNSLFKCGKIFQAARKYEKGCRFVDFETVFEDGDEKREAKSLKMSLKLNDAACKLKLKDYSEAINLTTKCLEGDPVNVKALYRRAQAYSATMDLDLAEEDIRKALEIDPENRDTKLEQKRLNQKIAAHRKKEAKLYGNMFERMRKMEEKESKQPGLGLATLAQDEPVQGNPEQASMQANAPQVSVQG